MAGVDGCPGGWVAAIVDLDSLSVTWRRLADAAGVVALLDDVDVVGIDIPIGLPRAGQSRACDALARVALRERRSCVFPAPPRVVLAEPDFQTANVISRRVSGKGISKQAFHIGARIVDVDRVLDPAQANRVVEVHPELSFAAMAGHPLVSKKTPAGLVARGELLSRWLHRDVAALVDARPRGSRADDALDAIACAWSASRWRDGQAEVRPPEVTYDDRGRPMRIIT